MSPAVIWLILGLVLIAAEVLSGEFVLLMLGGGALAAVFATGDRGPRGATAAPASSAFRSASNARTSSGDGRTPVV